jgi:hypothetical protein
MSDYMNTTLEPKRPIQTLAQRDAGRRFDQLVENELVNFVHYLEDLAQTGGRDGDDKDMSHFVQIRRSWAKSIDATMGRVDYGMLAVLEWIVNWYTPNMPKKDADIYRISVRFDGIALKTSIGTISRQTYLSRSAVRANLEKLAVLKLIRIEANETNTGCTIEVEPHNLERLYHGLPLDNDDDMPMDFFDENPHTIRPGCRLSKKSEKGEDYHG